ncbi:hypothetical protein GQ473_04140 [archaeon]|nr:hypothetical protein [archaeon]
MVFIFKKEKVVTDNIKKKISVVSESSNSDVSVVSKNGDAVKYIKQDNSLVKKQDETKEKNSSVDNNSNNNASPKKEGFERDTDKISSDDFKKLENSEDKKKGFLERIIGKNKKISVSKDENINKNFNFLEYDNLKEVSKKLCDVSKRSEDTLMDLEKLTGKLEAEKGFREGLSEKSSLLSEQIGELRSMILDREKNLSGMDTTFELIKDQVHDVNPQRIKKEFDKQERKFLESSVRVERLEGILTEISNEMKVSRKQMEKIKSVDNVIRAGEEIDKKLKKMNNQENYIEKTSAKVEQIFLDLNMRTKDIVVMSEKLDGIDELSKDLLGSVEKNSLKLKEVVFKEELTKEDSEVKTSITKITKEFHDILNKSLNEAHKSIDDILPTVKELEKETEKLKALRVLNPKKLKKLESFDISKAENILDFELKLNNIEQGLVGFKSNFLKNLNELDSRLNQRTNWESFIEKQICDTSNKNDLLFSKYKSLSKIVDSADNSVLVENQLKMFETQSNDLANLKKTISLVDKNVSKKMIERDLKIKALSDKSNKILKSVEEKNSKLNDVPSKEEFNSLESEIKNFVDFKLKDIRVNITNSLTDLDKSVGYIMPTVKELKLKIDYLKAFEILNPEKLKVLESFDISKFENAVDFGEKVNKIECRLFNVVDDVSKQIRGVDFRIDSLSENKNCGMYFDLIKKQNIVIERQLKDIELMKKSILLIEHQLSKERNAGYLKPQSNLDVRSVGVSDSSFSSTGVSNSGVNNSDVKRTTDTTTINVPVNGKKITDGSLKELIEQAKKFISSGDIISAKILYKRIKEDFSGLSDMNEKAQMYRDIMDIYTSLNN